MLNFVNPKKFIAMNNTPDKEIYARNTLEFVTVAAEFCAFLEQSEGREKGEFQDTLLKLLPLLYVKAVLVPRVESDGDFLPAPQVTEQDYEWIRRVVYDIMQEDDDYEDLIRDEDMQTDESRWKSISEGLADMYQALRDFVSSYQQRVEDCMTDALWAVMDKFELYWGQCLVDTLRQLHRLRYANNT